MSVSIGIILVMVAGFITVIVLAPAVAPAESDQAAARPTGENPRPPAASHRRSRRLRSIPPQRTVDHRRSLG
ncbi:hypothetical protein [Streptomyces sp. NPDC002990]